MKTKKRLQRTLVWAAILSFTGIFVCNIHWVEYRFLNGPVYAFSVTPFMVAVCAAVLAIAAFQEEIEMRFYRLDGRLFGQAEHYVPPEASIHYDRLFLWMAFAIGLLFVFLVPPMAAPDETNHFTRAYLLAHGQFLPVLDASKRAVGMGSSDLRDFLSVWNATTSDPSHKITAQMFGNLLKTTVSNGTPSISIDYPYPYLSFFLYIPQALGIRLGSLLFALFHANNHYNIYIQLVFARIANLAFFIGCMALAIRTSPFFKRTITLLALMPMTVFIASSCSYDVFLYSFCFLYITYVLKCAYDPTVTEIRGRQIGILVFLQFCIIAGKYVYFPLLFLIFLIPQEKFHGQPKRKILLTTVLPSVLCTLIWLVAYKVSTVGMVADVYSRVYREQAQFILLHPVKYMAILLDNLYLYRGNWVTGFVGLFGWLNVPLPMGFVIFYVVLLIASAILETVINRSFLSRRMLGVAAAACYILVATAEYVIWTPSLGNGKVGQSAIIGVQGRYFIPFAFPILLLLANKLTYRTYLFGKLDTVMHRCAVFILAGSLLFSVIFLLRCYWL